MRCPKLKAILILLVFMFFESADTLADDPAAGSTDVMTGVPPARHSQVTFANYRFQPFNSWAFRNIGAPLNVIMIPRSGGIRRFADNGNPRIGKLELKDAEGRMRNVDKILQENFTDGFLVLKGDDVLYERYFNGFHRDYQHIWFSMTKSLASTAFGLLVEQGKVDLDESPAYYIPELKGSGFERVTIQNVLDHTSAIDFKENYTDPDSDFFRYYAPALNMAWLPGARDIQPDSAEIYGVHDFLAKFIRPDTALIPGAAFDYNSANADVLGWLIARLSGTTFDRFIQENIWSRLGMEHDAYIAVDRAYMPVATGGMNSTLRDAARFGRLILNRGDAGGVQIVPAAWVDASLDVSGDDIRRMKENSKYRNEPWQAYRNMWWVLDAENGEYAAVGVYGQVIYINRSQGLVIAWFSSQPVASAANNLPFRSKLLAARAIAAEFGNGGKTRDR